MVRMTADKVVLMILCKLGSMKFGEIMKIARYSKGSVSMALRKLLNEGYVTYENGRYRAIKCPDILEVIRGGSR